MKIVTNLILSIFLFGSCNQINSNKDMENTITVKAQCTFASAIGYGNIYRCNFKSNEFEQMACSIVLIEDDKQTFLEEHPSPEFVTLEFEKVAEMVDYKKTTFSGFVDDKKNAWKLISIK